LGHGFLTAAAALGDVRRALLLSVLLGVLHGLDELHVLLLELLVERDGVARGVGRDALVVDLLVVDVDALRAECLLANPDEDLLGVFLQREHVEHLRQLAHSHLGEQLHVLGRHVLAHRQQQALDGLAQVLEHGVALQAAAPFRFSRTRLTGVAGAGGWHRGSSLMLR
jgi:hypothetical protein